MMKNQWSRLGLIAATAWCAVLSGCAATPQAQPAISQAQPVARQTPARSGITQQGGGLALGNGVANVQLIVEPDDKTRRLTRPLRAARQSVDLTMYLLTDRTLIHDLEYAAAHGAAVRVILEQTPFGEGASSRSANQSAYDQLSAADIPVRWASSRYQLTHQKTMIIDGQTAYILTLNYTYSAFSKNREFAVIDHTPADVREAEAIFNADWTGATPALPDPNLFVSPVNSRARMMALLARARHSVDVYAEEVQDTAIEDVLVAAARRHVQVRLISNAGDSSNARGIVRLRQGGVAVHLVSAPYIHAKLVLVDGRWAFVGSENFSPTSLDRNRELGVLISDPTALQRLQATFARDWNS
ncbi:MAG TPA: phospholipase D-like domain-containing protein [Chloroflexota bacterium]|nr:phospholipase D-like domain-containing protein [Chloroflexota bacterium]